MNIKRKNGFTVVELVIIIAVIAILAAVLIPTFSSIVKKASESTDIQTVRNLNTAIKIDAVHHNSMHDALAAAKANGFAVEQVRSIGSGGDNFVAWDSVNDRFVIIKKGDGVNENDKFIFPSPEGEQTGEVKDKVAYFVFYDDVPTEQTYSIYLDGNNKTLPVVVSVGFDVGENYGIESVTYTGTVSDRNIILRTNNTGTNLIVSDTTNSTIAHFGDSGNQTINSGALSFHEYGGALKATITGGHYVAEGGSIVVVLDASASDGSVIVDLESGSVQGTVKNTNTNTQNTVTINGKPGAKTISFVADTNNNLKATFATPPTYTNTTDVGNDGDDLYITGVGNETRYAETATHDHNFVTVSGSSIMVCTICGEYKYENNDGTEVSHTHSWSETPSWSWSGDAENEFTAVATFTCECGSTVSVIAPKGTNNTVIGPTVVNPGCTTDGRTYYTANIYFNGNPYSSDENVVSTTPAHGHSWGEWTVTTPATCEEAGEETRFCSYDGSHKDTRPINPLGHDIVHHEAQAATYNAAGWNAYDTCSRCEYSTYQEIPKLTVGVKFPNTDKYLYRVGNQNAVAVSSLFDGTVTNVGITTVTGASGTYNNGNITFSGTGVVKVTANNSVDLYLEVVDAWNATTATSATDKNVVLLNDVSVNGSESIKINNGYALYGNGFKINCTGDGITNSSVGLGTGYITISGGSLLDNVMIIAPDFPKAYLYTSYNSYEYYVTEDENKVSDNHYAYQLSAVKTSGTATITNSYIYGARNNILADGNLTVDNCVLSNGSLANIHFDSQTGTLNLKDVTTIQYLRTFNYQLQNQSAKAAKVIGVGILMGAKPDSNAPATSNPTLNISGYLKQHNWICSDYSDITSSKIAKSLITNAVGKSNYQHSLNNTTYVDVGVVYMNNLDNLDQTINDTRTNHGYVLDTVSISGASGKVYAPGANTETVELKDSSYEYAPNRQGRSLPHLVYSDIEEDVKTFVRNAAFDYTFTVSLDAGSSYNFDFNKLAVKLLGENATYTIKDSSNNTVSSNLITLNSAGTTRYTITVTSSKYLDSQGNQQNTTNATYNISLALIVDVAELPAPVKTSDPSGGGIRVGTGSGNSLPAVSAIEGLKVEYWSTSQNKVVELTFDSNTGLSNGNVENDNDYTYIGNDFSLRIQAKGSQIKTDNAGGFWCVAGKLYFGPKSGTSTWLTAKSYPKPITLTYTFTDNSGHSIDFTHAWTISAPSQNSDVYIWDKFQSGTLEPNSDSCLVPGTLITLADGTQKPVEQITSEDRLLTWDFVNGRYVSSDVFCVTNHGVDSYAVTRLVFSDGSEVKLISEHGLFDADTNKFVNITSENANEYIGHKFVKFDAESGTTKVELISAETTLETTSAYSIIAVEHLDVIANEFWTLDPSIYFLLPFGIDSEYRFNSDEMSNDIETYGLMEYDEFKQYAPFMTEEQFIAGSGKYIKIALGKGIITMDEIMNFAKRILVDQDYIV